MLETFKDHMIDKNEFDSFGKKSFDMLETFKDHMSDKNSSSLISCARLLA